MRAPFFGEIIFRSVLQSDPWDLHMRTKFLPPKNKEKKLQSFKYNKLPRQIPPSHQ